METKPTKTKKKKLKEYQKCIQTVNEFKQRHRKLKGDGASFNLDRFKVQQPAVFM